MVPQVEVLAVKLDDRSAVPRIHMVESPDSCKL